MKPAAIILCLALILGAATFACAQDDTAALYKAKCQSCHGADGKATTPIGKRLEVKDINSPEVVKLSEFELFRIVRTGKDKMPGYENKLTDDQILALVRYMRKLK